MRELKDLEKNPPEGIRIQTNDEDMLDVTGIVEGPGEQLFLAVSYFWDLTLNGNARSAYRRYTLRWRILQSKVPFHKRVSRGSTKMSVYSLWFMRQFWLIQVFSFF